MKRLFNAIQYTLQCKSGVSPDTFKGHLDKWLRTISDTPKIDNYGASFFFYLFIDKKLSITESQFSSSYNSLTLIRYKFFHIQIDIATLKTRSSLKTILVKFWVKTSIISMI